MTYKKPKVTVLMSTYNRPEYIGDAISSVVGQKLQEWELIVMNDGGVDVGSIVSRFNDSRIRYFNDEVNRGKAVRMNFGLQKARGDYIAYLDDDDIYYPEHLQVLTEALDKHPHIGAVYSDLYAVRCVNDKRQGKRYPIHKFIQVSRDFNRDFMFYFNHTLHVSLMHRKDIAIRAGGYDEDVRILIDWDITRKLCFYTDFLYIPQVTGEYYLPMDKANRISVLGRENVESYRRNVRKIKADLPPEPWDYVKRVGVVFPVSLWNEESLLTIKALIDSICYPVRFFIVNNDQGMSHERCMDFLGDLGKLKNITLIHPHRQLSLQEAYRLGAAHADVDYLYLPSMHAETSIELRIMAALHHQVKTGKDVLRWDMEGEEGGRFDIFVKKEKFLGVDESSYHDLKRDAEVIPRELPESFASDFFLHEGTHQYQAGNYRFAYAIFKEAESIDKGGASRQFLINHYSKVCFELGMYEEAKSKLKMLIDQGYEGDNLVKLGFILQHQGDIKGATAYYVRALKQIGLKREDLDAKCFPIATHEYIGAFEAIVGIGECLLEKGNLPEAAKMFRLAAKLKANSPRPFIGFARIFIRTNALDDAEGSLADAIRREKNNPEAYFLLGQVFEKQMDIKKAYINYRHAFSLDKADRRLVEPIYRTGSATGNWTELKDIFEDYLSHHPGDMAAMGYLSTIYEKLGNLKKSKECYEKFIFLRSLMETKDIKEVPHEY